MLWQRSKTFKDCGIALGECFKNTFQNFASASCWEIPSFKHEAKLLKVCDLSQCGPHWEQQRAQRFENGRAVEALPQWRT